MEYLTHPYVIYAIGGTLILLSLYFLMSSFSFGSYEAKTHLMTKAERNFHYHLIKAVEGKAQIFSMVRVADLVDIKASIKGKKRMERLGKIAQKHFDFVLVDNDTKILAAIELNDSSHDRQERKERDEFLTKLMDSVGIPLLKIKAARHYDIDLIRKYLNAHLPIYFPKA